MKIVWIDWDIIREKGKNAELTADVIDALVEMAKVGVRHTTRPDDCLQCGATSYFTELQHVEGCPILILKAACEICTQSAESWDRDHVEALDDEDMARIAEKVGEAVMALGYWDAVKAVLEQLWK